MSSFKGSLVIDGDEYTLMSCSMSAYQMTDQYGVPRDRVKCDSISLLIESSKRDNDIAEWATNPKMKKDVGIYFYRTDASSIGTKIECRDAYCIQYGINFSNNDDKPMTLQITISAMQITINDNYKITTPIFDSKKGQDTQAGSSSNGEKKPITSFKTD
jgi:hypothetical protein